MSAQETLNAMKGGKARLAPPMVYRVLPALMDASRAHKLLSMNALVPCQCDMMWGRVWVLLAPLGKALTTQIADVGQALSAEHIGLYQR